MQPFGVLCYKLLFNENILFSTFLGLLCCLVYRKVTSQCFFILILLVHYGTTGLFTVCYLNPILLVVSVLQPEMYLNFWKESLECYLHCIGEIQGREISIRSSNCPVFQRLFSIYLFVQKQPLTHSLKL